MIFQLILLLGDEIQFCPIDNVEYDKQYWKKHAHYNVNILGPIRTFR